MSREQFIEQYVITFLATWTANNYSEACMSGNHQRLREPPVEDAYFLAEKAWEHKNEIIG
jgi:hypothetical protein